MRALRDHIVATYRAGDHIPAIRAFFASTGMTLPEPQFQHIFGNRTPADIANDHYFYLHELQGTAGYRPNLDALRAVSSLLIIGRGETSTDLFCDNTSRALAAELKIEPTIFPGGHTGFKENPPAFAARLREVIG